MSVDVNTSFDVYSDTPEGRDPDSHSPTLRRYHRLLWSKPLPDGTAFILVEGQPGTYLYHQSRRGAFCLSSDAIGHTYRCVKAMTPILEALPAEEIDRFFCLCSTIGAYILFPSRKVGGKATINGARGLNAKIRDRFDLTLECIRRHYLGQESLLGDALARYASFFDLFGDFRGYVDFFLLQDLVSEAGSSIDFFLPFSGFDVSPLPADPEQYRWYKDKVTAFVTARNQRINEWTAE